MLSWHQVGCHDVLELVQGQVSHELWGVISGEDYYSDLTDLYSILYSIQSPGSQSTISYNQSLSLIYLLPQTEQHFPTSQHRM